MRKSELTACLRQKTWDQEVFVVFERELRQAMVPERKTRWERVDRGEYISGTRFVVVFPLKLPEKGTKPHHCPPFPGVRRPSPHTSTAPLHKLSPIGTNPLGVSTKWGDLKRSQQETNCLRGPEWRETPVRRPIKPHICAPTTPKNLRICAAAGPSLPMILAAEASPKSCRRAQDRR